MIRQTSIDCYHEIRDSGLLSKRRFEVYCAILNTAPCTSAEALKTILTQSTVLSQGRGRFTELRELGVIKEIGVKKCTVTGRTAIEWDLTDRLPKGKISSKKGGKPKNLNKSIQYIISKMREEQKIFLSVSDLEALND